MSDISKDIKVLSREKLELLKDASKGDIINLNDLNNVDTISIEKLIEASKDIVYQRKLDEEIKNFELKKENELKDHKNKIDNLKDEIKKVEKDKEIELKNKFEIEKSNLEKQILSLEEQKKSSEQITRGKVEKEFAKEKEDLKNKIKDLENNLSNSMKILDLEHKNKINSLEKEKENKINNLNEEINKLRLSKASLNVKKQGEELEKWCNEEYKNYSVSGFENCGWYKDNDISLGSKADYIFKVYSNSEFENKNLLTSVVCEMKSENPKSTYKSKNKDHFKKLDQDRKKRDCEYALLISELEWDTSNDSLIEKVSEYEKMYVVRPPFFIVFISLIYSLSKKYEEVKKRINKNKEKFKDSKEILDQFEEFKNNILDNSLKHIDNNIKSAMKDAFEIERLSKRIQESCKVVLDTHINTVKNKIEDFSIKSIISKIENLDN